MPYIGQRPSKGDENNFKILDDISSYTLTFDGSDSSVVSAANDTITSLTHRFVQGQRVTYNNGGGSNIAGLTSGTVYYVIKHDHHNIKLATSASNAANGVAVNITNVGSGASHTINVAFDGVNTKFKATHSNGVKAKVTRSAQLVISINGVIQQPHDTATPSTGFGFDLDGTIVLSQAPASTDIFWAHVLTNNNVTFDISNNDLDSFTGNGSTTVFNLSKTPPDNRNILVTIDGVVQRPNDPDGTTRAYSVVENVLTFASAPASGTEIQVRHIGFAGSTSGSGGVTNFYGRTGSIVLKNTDNIVVGDANITGNLTVDGDFTTLNTTLREVELLRVDANSTAPAGIITQRGSGDILKLYDGASQVVTVGAGGSVGIGTDDPGAPLQVYGDIKITNDTGGSIQSNGLRTTPDGKFQLLRNNPTNNQAVITIDDDNGGRVGIGTTIPTQILHIHNAAPIIQFTDTNGLGSRINADSGNLYFDTHNNNRDIIFRGGNTSTNEVARITGDGLVGIGTNAPNAPLHVEKNGTSEVIARFESNYGSQVSRHVSLTSPTADSGSLPFTFSTGNAFEFRCDDHTGLFVDSDGRVGIHTRTVPTQGICFVGVQTSSNNYDTQPTVRFAAETNKSATHGDVSAVHIGQRAGGSADPAIIFHRRTGSTAWQSWSSRIHQGLEKLHFGFSGYAMPGSHSYSDVMVLKRNVGVGIGTDNPDTLLHVYGSSATQKLITLAGGVSKRNNYIGIVNSDNLEIGADEDNQGGDSSIRFRIDGSEKVRITSTGQVGIGTDSSNVTLDIYNDSAIIKLNDTDSTAGTNSYFQIANLNGNTYFYTRANSANGSYLIGGHGGGTFDEFVRITAGGRVGIGSANPSEKLDVAGHIKLDSGPVLENASTNGDSLKITTSTGYVEVGSQNTSYAHFYTDLPKYYFNKRIIVNEGIIGSYDEDLKLNTDITEERVRIKNDTGFVGIGTNDPGAQLEIYRNSAVFGHQLRIEEDGTGDAVMGFALTGTRAYSIGIDNSDSDKFKLATGSDLHTDTFVTVTTGGNVGIGTDNPSTKLDVDGDITIRNGKLIFNTALSGTNDVAETIRIDDQGGTGDRGLQFFEVKQGGARQHRIQFNLNSSSDGSSYTHTQGSYGGSSVIEFANGGQIKFMTMAEVGAGSTSNITLSEKLRITTVGDLVHTSTNRSLSLVDTQNVSQAGTKIAFFGANRYDTDEEFAAIKGLLVSNSGGSGKQNGSLQFIVGSASHTHTMSQGGYVGIGTGNPLALLHLQGEGGGNTSGLYFKNGPYDVVRQYFANGNDNSDFVITYDGTGGAEITLKQTGDLVLNESNGADVGIGIAAPQGKLHISSGTSGDCELIIESDTDDSNENDNPRILFRQDGGQNHSCIEQSNNELTISNSVTSGGIVFKTGSSSPYTNATEVASITSSGYLSVVDRIIHTGDTNTGIQFINNDEITFNAGGAKMTLDGSNLGIGITNPGARLQVQNNIRLFNSTGLTGDLSGSGWLFQATANNASPHPSHLSISHSVGANIRISTDGLIGFNMTGFSDTREQLHSDVDDSGANYLRFTNSTTGNGATDGLNIGLNSSEQALFWLFENDDLIFGNNNKERLRIHESGKISVNNPSLSNQAVLHLDTTTTEDMHNVANRTDYTLFLDSHHTGSDSVGANRTKAGIRNDVEYATTTGTSNTSGDRISVYGIHSSLDMTKAAYVSVGGYLYVTNNSDNATTTQTIQGCYGYARGYGSSTGVSYNIYGGYFLGYRGGNVNAGHCYGIYARAHHTTNGSGKTGDMTAVYAECEFDEENITTAYAFRGHMDRDAGTITNGYILYGSYSGDSHFTNRWGIHIADAAKNKLGGTLEVTGDITAPNNKSFRIPHPLVGLSTTKDLVHAAIEGPQVDLIYRGKTTLVAGISTVNLDTKSGMTEGTFVALNRDVQCFTTNETGWTNVKGSVTGNQLTIIAQENTCTDTISWMVIGERQDDSIKSAALTDADGKLILEPDQEIDDNIKYQPECEKNIYNEDPNTDPNFEE